MKNAKKVLILLVCVIVLIATSVLGTLAYLTNTASIENTFTVGKVAITLTESMTDEYGVVVTDASLATDYYKLIPGHKYTKNPIITVSSDSENCYLFVKIENGLGDQGELNLGTEWNLVDGTTDVYMYMSPASHVAAGTSVPVFTEFVFGTQADPEDYTAAKIKVTAYAIQADGLATFAAKDIWALFPTT